MMHECIGCKIKKPLTSTFFREANNSRGYYARCRDCVNEQRRKKRLERKKNQSYKKVDEIKCTSCEIVKEANPSNYHRDTNSSNGYASRCKVCANKDRRKQRHKIRENKAYIKLESMSCNICNKSKPLNEDYFYRDTGDITGYHRSCIECALERRKQTPPVTYTEEDYIDLEEYTCMGCGITKPLNLDNFYQRKDSITRYNQRCKLCYNESRKESNRIASQRRRTLKKQLPSNFTSSDWEYVLTYFNHGCAYCGVKGETLEQEHVVPVSKGGGYIPENIIPSCASCNSSKNAKDLNEWYPSYDKYKNSRMLKINQYLNSFALESKVI